VLFGRTRRLGLPLVLIWRRSNDTTVSGFWFPLPSFPFLCLTTLYYNASLGGRRYGFFSFFLFLDVPSHFPQTKKGCSTAPSLLSSV